MLQAACPHSPFLALSSLFRSAAKQVAAPTFNLALIQVGHTQVFRRSSQAKAYVSGLFFRSVFATPQRLLPF